MTTKKIREQKTCRIVLALGFIIYLAYPGFSASKESERIPIRGKKDSLNAEMYVFRLALPKQERSDNLPLFTLDNSALTGANHPFPSFKLSATIPPQSTKITPKKVTPLGDSLHTASLLTLTALNIVDYASSIRALRHPGLEEGNPILRPFTKNMLLFSAVKLGMTALDYYVLKSIYKKNKTLGWVLSIAGNIAMSYIVSQNIRKIQSVTRH
jgi:hypothetical protein